MSSERATLPTPHHPPRISTRSSSSRTCRPAVLARIGTGMACLFTYSTYAHIRQQQGHVGFSGVTQYSLFFFAEFWLPYSLCRCRVTVVLQHSEGNIKDRQLCSLLSKIRRLSIYSCVPVGVNPDESIAENRQVTVLHSEDDWPAPVKEFCASFRAHQTSHPTCAELDEFAVSAKPRQRQRCLMPAVNPVAAKDAAASAAFPYSAACSH